MNISFRIKRIYSIKSLWPYIKDYKNTSDSYLVSPNYYILTGRKGLYIFKKHDSYILFCNHPNQKDSFLIFPLVKSNQVRTLTSFVKEFSELKKIQVIRFQFRDLNIYQNSPLNIRVVTEEILDWKFPSVEISTELVNNMTGGKFQDLRYNINKIDVKYIKLETFCYEKHFSSSIELTKKWCDRNISKKFNFENLSSLYFEILNNYKSMNGMIGYVLYYKENLVAFNFLEKTIFSEEEMVSLAFIADIDYKGIPSFMRYMICKSLYPNIKKITIGGAETYGLYKFKKKLNPINEIELKTLEITVASPRS